MTQISSIQQQLAHCAANLPGWKADGESAGWALCEAHGDQTPSLHVIANEKGGWVTCHACDESSMALHAYLKRYSYPALPFSPAPRPTGKTNPTGARKYVYAGAESPVLRVTRKTKPDGSKGYYQERYEDGKWVSGGLKATPLYNGHILRNPKTDKSQPVFIVEGEKCADLGKLEGENGFIATTAPEGSGKFKKVGEDYIDLLKPFANRIILPDNDLAGYEHALQVGNILQKAGMDSHVLLLPGLPPKGDLADWLPSNSAATLLALASSAMPFGDFKARFKDLSAAVGGEKAAGAAKGEEESSGPGGSVHRDVDTTDLSQAEILDRLLARIPALNQDNRMFFNTEQRSICYFNRDLSWNPIHKRHELANVLEGKLGIRFLKTKEKDGATETVRVSPNAEVMDRLLVLREHDLPLPTINEFTTHPMIAPDGTLVIEPGLHPSGIFYKPTVDMDPIPPQPTADQVAAAVRCIEELVADFPFADIESKQAWWAYVLTPLMGSLAPRPCPMFHFSANVPGTGKGMLAGIPGWIMPPQPGAQSLDKTCDSEVRKTLTAQLASGHCGWLILDNIKGRLDSPSLEAFLTTEIWTDRILGSSRTGSWRIKTSLAVTANNLSMSKDLERRQILIRMLSKTPEPHLRNDFKIGDLRLHIEEHRAKLTWSLVLILQNWLVKGRPKGANRLGSFERWSEAIGGVLDAAGIGSEFLAKQRTAVAGDMDAWTQFMTSWVESTVPLDRQHTQDLVKVAKSSGINLTESGATRSLGRQMWKQNDRPFRIGTQVYILKALPYGKQTLWSLTKTPTEPTPDPDRPYMREKRENNPNNPTELYTQGILQNPTEKVHNPKNPTNGLKPHCDTLQNPTESYQQDIFGVSQNEKPDFTEVCGVNGLAANPFGVSQDPFPERVCGVNGVLGSISPLHVREGEKTQGPTCGCGRTLPPHRNYLCEECSPPNQTSSSSLPGAAGHSAVPIEKLAGRPGAAAEVARRIETEPTANEIHMGDLADRGEI